MDLRRIKIDIFMMYSHALQKCAIDLWVQFLPYKVSAISSLFSYNENLFREELASFTDKTAK